ncbi:hypothetical protein LTR47_004623 [Exophiala xenobiotica]|nr:hypothetical protein LTR47_004623 [Exophiala xenobiotica]
MFEDLPVEVIQQIIRHLSTSSSIINLSLTNHKVHAIISADDYACFRTFVQRAFPSIKTPPLWRDAARALTSRSRAWDRRAFIARECCPPPENEDALNVRNSVTTVGYHPVIDSYETWGGSTWSSRKEVLAWGAAGRLRLRTIQDGVASWSSFRMPDDHRQDLDILDVKLLRPHQHENPDGETIILRRANGEVVKLESSKQDVFTQKWRYTMRNGDSKRIDVNNMMQPILATCDSHHIALYPVHSVDRNVRPVDIAPLQEKNSIRKRTRCAKFLSDTTLAIGVQFLQGRDRAPIHVYDVSPTGLSKTPLAEIFSFSEATYPVHGRHCANTIVPLDDVGTTSRRPGQVFLSGWSDGIARLHDVRVPERPVAEYFDVVDDGQILSLLPIGHERFLAGSHQNGCLKTFDLRMPGARAYSYLDARPPSARPGHRSLEPSDTFKKIHSSNTQRDINIFLTPTINYGERLWQPLARRPARRANRYRGSVYSLSSPSPSSPTVYAGIENHVLQLDFVSTDDFRSGVTGLVDPSLGLYDKSNHVLNFSCYERPRHGHESTDPVLLRKQLSLTGGRRDSHHDGKNSNGTSGELEPGWDDRWRLETYDRTRGRNLAWGGPQEVVG